MQDWQPTASIEALRSRARIVEQVRQFFSDRAVLEVDTPALSSAAVSDPQLTPFSCEYRPDGGGPTQRCFLQTSPEYPMKRLLAAGSGPIWQLCKVFRNGETGSRHNPEFSMLEWYRPGLDHHALMDEVEALVCQVLGLQACRRRLYSDCFAELLQIDVHSCGLEQLAEAGRVRCGFHGELDRNGWLNLLFSHCVEPQLQDATMVYGFPASQAALARVVDGDDRVPVAARFELFVQGMELANGYFELTDPAEQARRFAADQAQRRAMGVGVLPVDARLVAALRSGMPECAGVALGFDRLVMLASGSQKIEEVLAFPFERA